jgi:hypothetical protein
MAASINHLAALRGDLTEALVLKPEALIDRSLAALRFRHPPLLLDQPVAVRPVSLTLRSCFLVFDGKLAVQDDLLFMGLLLLRRSLLPLKLKLLFRVALLLLKLVDLRLVVPNASVFQSLVLSFLLFQKLLLMLSPCRLLLLKRPFLPLMLQVLLV